MTEAWVQCPECGWTGTEADLEGVSTPSCPSCGAGVRVD